MRIITVEEHFEHAEVGERVLQLSGPPSGVPLDELDGFDSIFNDDRDAATRLGGHRLAHMDAVGVDVQVVSHGNGSPSTLAAPESVELCRQVNNDLAQQISEHSERFRGFATLPLYEPASAAEELRRCVGDLGFVGALIAGTFEGRFLDDARFDPILAAAEAVDLPIYVHPGLPHPQVSRPYYFGDWSVAVSVMFSGPGFGWHAEAGVHVIRLILSGALDRHPGLKLLSGHWGEVMAFWLGRLDETFALVRPSRERNISDYYREQIWVTPSGMFNRHQLDHVVAELGAERIIYSEDYPYIKRDDVTEFLTGSGLSDHQMHAIAHTNVEALLRI
jgi:uncharacterized protein